MALEIKQVSDPDFPARKAYQIECPRCHKIFMGTTENFVKNTYTNHRQVHNGEE